MWTRRTMVFSFINAAQVLKFTLWIEETGSKASVQSAPSRRYHHPLSPRQGYVGSEIIVFWGLRS